MILGCDFHTRYQQIAMMDDSTEELIEAGGPLLGSGALEPHGDGNRAHPRNGLTKCMISNARNITEGGSISVGAQATPLMGFQATGNSSGILGGPTVGVPGGSVTATYGFCF